MSGRGASAARSETTTAASPSTAATVAVVVTFDSLCDLVRVYVDSQDVADSLCDKLDAAEAKKARTGVTDLKSFVNQVEAQSGKSMTATEAATLIRLAGAL